MIFLEKNVLLLYYKNLVKTILYFLTYLLYNSPVFGQNKNNLELINYQQSVCDQTVDPYRIKPRIISFKHHKDTLDIEIGFAATCCIDYIPDINYSNDTLYVKYKEKEGSIGCSCICCYNFSHKIKGIDKSKITVKLENEIIEISNEKYKTYKPTFTIVKKDTINLTDKYGFKQGIWPFKSKYFYRYKDDRHISTGHLHKNGKIKDESFYKINMRKEYYKNGKLKSECKINDKWEFIDCRRWNKKGKEMNS